MIERYSLIQTDKICDTFGVEKSFPRGVKPCRNIAPGQMAPVIVSRDDVLKLEMMKWGFVPANAKNDNSIFRYKTFCARSEDVFNKSIWIDSVRMRRCLVPCDGFYAWDSASRDSQPYFAEYESKSLFCMAGIYS